MFDLFRKKFSDPMKLKKFYYYSPDKLKLLQIKNFVPKFISILLTLAFFFTTIIVLIISYALNSNTKIVSNQENIIRTEYENEIITLKEKYAKLAAEFKELSKTTNDVRLAVNLEPLDVNDRNFGIGGTNFDNYSTAAVFNNKLKLSEIYEFVNSIETDLNFEKSNYEEIKVKFDENLDLFKCIPAIRPVNSSIGDRFGMRYHPILKKRRMHHGLDFLCNTGEKVVAPGDGIITYVGRRGGYGKVIRINHGFGYETIYGHLSKYKVKKGQKVKRGDLIAISGNSGSLSTGPHLHYEVHLDGEAMNPINYFFLELSPADYNRLILISKMSGQSFD
jgi:murein DD-endopeptidase MepM/ murein hydrolase activator NlpD